MADQDQPATPELDKASPLYEVSNQQGAFLDWLLSTKQFHLKAWGDISSDEFVEVGSVHGNVEAGAEPPEDGCVWRPRPDGGWGRWSYGRWRPRSREGWVDVQAGERKISRWLAEFHGLDFDLMERERQALLEWVQARANARVPTL